MSKTSREETKQMLMGLLNKLKEQGLVQEAGVLDMSSDEQVKRSKAAIDKLEQAGLPKKVIDILRNKMNEVENKKCKCSECFNFNTFETVLRDEVKRFDYTTVELNGKNFDIKYCESNDGEEYFMISDGYATIKEDLSPEQLQEELTKAVQDKDFARAQIYLDAINELKNQ